MAIVNVSGLSKVYNIAVKEDGLVATLKHFWHRQYRPIAAVKDISFEIESGEMVGFLGANGAGKTTTLKMLTGLVYPSSGKIQVAGYIPFRRDQGFLQKITLVMGQKQQLIWDLPAIDSLRMNAAVYDIPENVFKHRLGELTEMLSLEGKLSQAMRKLSLGERMKAELLAALLHQPQVLFLDEPTLGLDVNAQASVRKFLKEYNDRYGATILLTSHYMTDITALCKRVLLIHQGGLIYDGSLDSLHDSFAPYREVRVELGANYNVDAELSGFLGKYGQILHIDGQSVCFLVQREDLTRTVSQILAELEVLDLAVSEPAIEEVIGRVFSAGTVNN
ncbi:ATP-binding cassette domain-containing protein [Pseudanabaena sp. FACHB-1277]|uniref:ATP-binding cassette domain-containing protein n=1 Tax=Pseudanabaena cinerea FACHB-1277 TaxID=2949581 RepID=A0A926Z5V1_9CYAN|nr:ATP-binding cassette domain-containing protein [Pseudanabaena cinerea]MBD2150065.1 ATP-binding cassette domain-containing protein [Pseudanabaena cinerea FACHB-1277]